MNRNEVENTIKAWNEKINNFMENELPKLLVEKGIPVKNGKIKMNDWFKAQAIVKDQNFYQKGHEIQMKLRDAGYDVKMDMQSNKLVLY